MTAERETASVAEEDAAISGSESTGDQDQLTNDESAEAGEIRAEIEQTREEMGGTLSELGDRLEPGHLVNQAKENVREATIGRVEETAKGVSDMVTDTIRRNPIPAAIAGAGLALLWANRSKEPHQVPTGRGREQKIGDRVGDVASTVGETVSGAAGQIGETAGQVAQNVGGTVGEVGGQLDRFMQASPLALGAIAIGAGAVVGAVLPETSQEREVLGDASRQISYTVRDTVDTATRKADEALDRTEEKVGA